MIRATFVAAFLAVLATDWPHGPAMAEDPSSEADTLQLAGEGDALGSAALSDVNGGTLMGSPVEGDAWRTDETYPMEFPASVSAAGGPVAGAAITGADLGHNPPAGNEIGGAAGVAGDVAHTIW